MTEHFDAARTTAKPTRRTVTTAAAWTVPAVAIAATAPLAAASTPGGPVIVGSTTITSWKGDHHYGSTANSATERSYAFPVTVQDSNGNPVSGATVTITGNATNNRDGHIVWFYAGNAPSQAPNHNPDAVQPAVSTSTNGSGIATFAVNTQNLSSGERPVTGTFQVTVATPAGSTSTTYTYTITETD